MEEERLTKEKLFPILKLQQKEINPLITYA